MEPGGDAFLDISLRKGIQYPYLDMIYLDHNATTPLDPAVAEAMCRCLKEEFGNPSSAHRIGRAARQAVEQGRAAVAALIGCDPEEVYFTSGGTEANNLAILGTARRYGSGHIITSRIEHPSVLNPVRYLESTGFEVTYVGVDGDCRVSAEEVARAIRRETVLITIMHANNETGTLQPIEDIGASARERRVPFHTDAAQSVGKVPVRARPADMLTLVPHKFHGPKGVGALYVRKTLEPLPILFGAGHERGMRPGTENVAGIVGMGEACTLAGRNLTDRAARLTALRTLLREELQRGIEALRVHGHQGLCLPNTLNVAIPGVDAGDLTLALAEQVAVSPGSACHAGVKSPSAVLKAMGVPDEEALSSVRLSLGKDNTESEIRAAAKTLWETARQLARAR